MSPQGPLSYLGGKLGPHDYRSHVNKTLQEVSQNSFPFFFLCFDSRVLRTVILCLLQGRGCSQCEAAEQQTLWLRKLCSQRLLRRGHPQLSRKRTPDVIAWLESVLLVPSCYTAGVHTVLLCQIPCLCAIPTYKVVFQTPPLQTHPSLCLSCLIF